MTAIIWHSSSLALLKTMSDCASISTQLNSVYQMDSQDRYFPRSCPSMLKSWIHSEKLLLPKRLVMWPKKRNRTGRISTKIVSKRLQTSQVSIKKQNLSSVGKVSSQSLFLQMLKFEMKHLRILPWRRNKPVLWTVWWLKMHSTIFAKSRKTPPTRTTKMW